MERQIQGVKLKIPKQLQFHAIKEVSRLTIQNPSPYKLALKIRTNHLKAINIRPIHDFLDPNSKISFQVKLMQVHQNVKLQVNYAIATEQMLANNDSKMTNMDKKFKKQKIVSINVKNIVPEQHPSDLNKSFHTVQPQKPNKPINQKKVSLKSSRNCQQKGQMVVAQEKQQEQLEEEQQKIIKKYQQSLNSLKLKLKEEELKNKRLQSDNKQLTEQIHRQQKLIEELKAEIGKNNSILNPQVNVEMKNQLESIKKNIFILQQAKIAIEKQYEAQLNNIKKMQILKSNQINEKQKVIQIIEQKINKLKQNFSFQEKQFSAKKSDLQNNLREINEKIQQKQKQLQNLVGQVKQAHTTKILLSKEIHQCQLLKVECNKEISQKTNKLIEYELQITKIQKQVNILKKLEDQKLKHEKVKKLCLQILEEV